MQDLKKTALGEFLRLKPLYLLYTARSFQNRSNLLMHSHKRLNHSFLRNSLAKLAKNNNRAWRLTGNKMQAGCEKLRRNWRKIDENN
jgi:hypothetical protein